MNRIASNAAATWGRGLLTLVLGVFSGRWALKALGVEGYGLWAVCCSINMFACLVQGVIADATQRFLSVSVGAENWRAWYRASVRVHRVSALLTVALTVPIGWFLLGSFVSVPAGRLLECRIVLCFVFALSLVAMLNTPNRQLFAAHQRLVEPALWGMASTLMAFALLAWFVTHAGTWLVPYAAFLALFVTLTEGALAWRAHRLFRVGASPAASCVVLPPLASLFRYALWRLVASLGATASTYGMTLVVNRLFGASFAASAGLSRSTVTQVGSLSSALAAAYQPALANQAGRDMRGKDSHALASVLRNACTAQAGAFLALAVPLFLFTAPILRLWLDDVPPNMVVAVRWLLGAGFLATLGDALVNAVAARGTVRALFLGSGVLRLAVVPLAFLAHRLSLAGGGLGDVFAAVFVVELLHTVWSFACWRTASFEEC